MKLAECHHIKEDPIAGDADGLTHVICHLCGQCRKYKEGDEYSIIITKLGRIDGAIVIPPAGTRFDISPEESRLVKEGYDIINEQPGPSIGARKIELLREKEPEVVSEIKTVDEPTKEPEVVVSEPKSEKEGEAPPRFGTKKPYFDKRREAILADYGKMLVVDLENKWGMPKGYWYTLKQRWEGEGFTIPTAYADIPQEIPEVTPAPKKERSYSKRRPLSYWKKNRDQVIADYYSMTLVDFMKIWRLSSTLWMKIRKLLEIPKKSEGRQVQAALPPFPAFDNNWPTSVKIEWFKAFVELFPRSNK